MDVQQLESQLERAAQAKGPTPRDVRDALVDYYGFVGAAHVARGLVHTHPGADAALMRRLLVQRLTVLWRGLGSTWADPTLPALGALRERIDRWACARSMSELARAKGLLDEIFLAAAVTERMQAVKARPVARRLQVIEGGGATTPSRGRLRLVRPPSPGPSASSTSGSPSSQPSAPSASGEPSASSSSPPT